VHESWDAEIDEIHQNPEDPDESRQRLQRLSDVVHELATVFDDEREHEDGGE
jgi:hypothetical protein